MRTILLLAVIGAAAAGTAAEAQPWGASAGRGGGSHLGHGRPAPAPGLWRVRPLRDKVGHPDRRRGRFPGFAGGFGADGAYRTADPWGDGFFSRGGGEVRMRGNRPHYDYDRSYPYEWAPASGGPAGWDEDPRPAVPRCTVEHGVRVCRGG